MDKTIMFEPIKDLSKCRILISNDDGIHAPGLELLEEIAHSLSDDVWVVAPETEQSGAAHSLTLAYPLRIRKESDKRFAVNGTPSDCVLVACEKILGDGKPDIIISGINKGANLGDDVTYSGTIAAAMEGTLLGIPSIALSLVCKHGAVPQWHIPKAFAEKMIKKVFAIGWKKDVLLNINFPDKENIEEVKGVKLVSQGKRIMAGVISESMDPRHHPYIWIGGERINDYSRKDTDIVAVEEGFITITPLSMDLTHKETLERMQEIML